MDRTLVLGRWQSVRTARIYIEAGVADLGAYRLEGHSQRFVSRSALLLDEYLAGLMMA